MPPPQTARCQRNAGVCLLSSPPAAVRGMSSKRSQGCGRASADPKRCKADDGSGKLAKQDGDPEPPSATVLVFMAKNVYHMGYLLPNAHFDAPRVFDRYEETLEAHGASQRHNTRATLFHLRFVQGDTFRIGYARRTVQTPPSLYWDGAHPKHFLVRTI